MKKIWKKYWFIIVVIILCIIKQLVAASIPVFARDAGGPDQYKLLQDAESLYAGDYLTSGQYGIFALFKRAISFPLFLAICHWMGVSYMAGYTLLYTGASLLALYAIKQFTDNRILLTMSFVIILFCPFSYDSTVQMIYNLSFTAPLAVAGIACLMLVYCRLDYKNSIILFWSILSGINMCAIWLNREDSMWILPLVGVFLVITFSSVLKKRKRIGKKNVIIKILILSFPVISILAGDIGLSCINYVKYGIYTTNDYTATNFEKAYNSLLRIYQNYYPADCSITKEMLEQAYEVSPAVKELKPYMDEFYEYNSYDQMGVDPYDGEIEDSLMNIALRDAASRCGYYENANLANDYWGRVNEELEKAFEEEKIQKRSMFFFGSTLHHPWRKGANYTSMWIKSACKLIKDDILHTLAMPQVIYNYTDKDVTARYEAMTMNYSVDKPYYVLNIVGWLLTDDEMERYTLQLVNEKGDLIQNVKLLESSDIANSNKGNPQAERCRFNIECPIEGEEKIYLKVLGKSGEQTIAFENGLQYSGIIYHFDNIEKKCIYDADEKYANIRVGIAQCFANIYRLAGPILFFICMIGYLYKTWILIKAIKIKEYGYWMEWVFQSAILGSALILLLAISFVNAFMWGALFYTHTIGVLLDFGGATVLAIDGTRLWERIKNR